MTMTDDGTPAPLDVRQFAEELIAQIGGMMVMQRETKSATESMRGAYSDVLAIISDRLAALAAPLPGHQTPGEYHDYRMACVKCGEPGFLHVSWRPETWAEEAES